MKEVIIITVTLLIIAAGVRIDGNGISANQSNSATQAGGDQGMGADPNGRN